MRLLYWGALSWGSTSLARSRALSDLFTDYYSVNSSEVLGEYLYRTHWQRVKLRVAFPPLIRTVSAQLLRECRRFRPDYVWIDQGSVVSQSVLQALRRSGARLVHYTLDSLRAPGLLTPVLRDALREYDHCVTSKPHELLDYAKLGARSVLLGHDGIDPSIHRRVTISGTDAKRFGCDVVFVGQAMHTRAALVNAVASKTTASVKIYGRGWLGMLKPYGLQRLSEGWVFGDDYAYALCGAKIALGMLNDSVGDQQTTRSFEIPACGTFMLAQRTPALCDLFREGTEAAFFGSEEELTDKVGYYLRNEAERKRIANAGYTRVQTMRCSWRDRLESLLYEMHVAAK